MVSVAVVWKSLVLRLLYLLLLVLSVSQALSSTNRGPAAQSLIHTIFGGARDSDTVNMSIEWAEHKTWLPQYSPCWDAADRARLMQGPGFPDSSAAIHISGVESLRGFWPWCPNSKILLVYDPLTGAAAGQGCGDVDENPHIAGSADGVTFQSLRFDWDNDGVIDDTLMPMVAYNGDTVIWGCDTPGFTPDTVYGGDLIGQGTDNGPYLSDPDLYPDRADFLHLAYRLVFRGNGDSAAILERTTDSGLTWTQPRMIISEGWTPGFKFGAHSALVSPSMVRRGSDTIDCYVVEMDTNVVNHHSVFARYRNVGPEYDLGWHYLDTVHYVPLSPRYNLWHAEFIKQGDRCWGLITEGDNVTGIQRTRLVLAAMSPAGDEVTAICLLSDTVTIPITRADSTHNVQNYRSWGYWEGSDLILYMSAAGTQGKSSTPAWGTYREVVHFGPSRATDTRF